ncbi:hypothetical protein GCM10009527_072250 [Actinomadura nitritigenes]|uniref:Uncharacterized protein n=1 Tax=Actinomadura nitritigenes TaxID=134602 RepID=A0ABS3R581_9ACTN|nr:histidine kinase [Actinomadura nitritigenes]MBO2441385.1 hypothetical protein [Actinomadura nitritigenes]
MSLPNSICPSVHQGGSALPRDALGETGALDAHRERIGRYLSDTLVQEIFEVSLRLHGALPEIADPAAAERVRAALDALDGMVRRLRLAVFDLDAVAGDATER